MNPLNPVELRVLGVLVEKERTVPESYPLSVNALLAGCNQKSSREPVMQCTQQQVLDALDALRARSLVIESSGAKVLRYAHNLDRGLRIPALSAVLLAVLMLRGPQTAAALRLHAERLHRFADNSSVEGFLNELADRAAPAGGPLVRLLGRQAGEREERWTHLLGDAAGAGFEAGSGAAADARSETEAGAAAGAGVGAAAGAGVGLGIGGKTMAGAVPAGDRPPAAVARGTMQSAERSDAAADAGSGRAAVSRDGTGDAALAQRLDRLEARIERLEAALRGAGS